MRNENTELHFLSVQGDPNPKAMKMTCGRNSAYKNTTAKHDSL